MNADRRDPLADPATDAVLDIVGDDMPGDEPEHRQYRFAPPPGATTVLLIRHGESAPVRNGEERPLRDGHDDPALDPVGEQQAELLGERLADERVDAIYVTTLRRTHQTAAPLAKRLGITPIEVHDLREVFLGDFEGGELRRRAAADDPIMQQVWETQRWDAIPNAESTEEFGERISRGLAQIVAAHPDQRVAVVVHGGVIAELLRRAAGSDQPFSFISADNASISELVVSGERSIIRRFNDTAHLTAFDAARGA